MKLPGTLRRMLAAGLIALAAGPALAEEPTLYPGERLVDITLPDNGHLIEEGWTRTGKAIAYRLKVPKGTKLRIFMKASSHFTFLVVFDLNDVEPKDAIYSSDVRPLPAHITAENDMDLLIRPYFAKIAARRGLGAHFEIEIRKDP